MRPIQLYSIIFIVISIIISFISYLLPNEVVKQHLHLIYSIHFILILFTIPLIKDKTTFLLSPSFLALAYTYITFIIGGWAFNNGMILWKNTLVAFNNWEHTNVMVSFIISCSTLAHLSYFFLKKPYQFNATRNQQSTSTSIVILTIALFWFAVFSVFKFDMSFLGGLGDYAIIPKTIAALTIISVLATNRYRLRFFYYLLIIVTFAAFSFNDKREAVFLLVSIVLLEGAMNGTFAIKLRARLVIQFTLIAFFTVYLILAMSILRGYGGFNTKSFPVAITKVPEYVRQPNFLPAFFQNIEVSITFYHSHQAIEFIENDKSLMTMGSTLIKFIYVPIPSYLIKKPESIIKAYTGYYNLADFQANVSWPINFFSELYWNFGYWGAALTLLFIGFFNKVYFFLLNFLQHGKLLQSIVLIFMYQNFIFFIRGSGLDLYFFYFLLSSIVFLFCFYLPYLLLLTISKNHKSKNEQKSIV